MADPRTEFMEWMEVKRKQIEARKHEHEEKIQNLIRIDDQLIADLDELISVYNSIHKKLNMCSKVTKFLGATGTILTNAGTMAAPFTGGSSVIVQQSGNAIETAANLGRQWLEAWATKENRKLTCRLEQLAEEHDQYSDFDGCFLESDTLTLILDLINHPETIDKFEFFCNTAERLKSDLGKELAELRRRLEEL